MDYVPSRPHLEIPPGTPDALRKKYGLDKRSMNESIDSIENWLKKEPYMIKKDYSRFYLETTIISNKGSVEKTKMRLEKLCVMRGLLPKFFEKTNSKVGFDSFHKALQVVPLPKLMEDHARMYVCKAGESIKTSDILDYYRYAVISGEYIRNYDYNDGFMLIIDLRKTNLKEVIMNLNPVDMRQGIAVLLEGYGVRVRGIHLITESKLINVLVDILKQVVTEKIANRIYSHKNLDTLSQYVPIELMPEEYGGKQKSVDKLQEMWIEAYGSKEHVEHLEAMRLATTDESCRATDKFNEMHLGTPGTFRTLSLD